MKVMRVRLESVDSEIIVWIPYNLRIKIGSSIQYENREYWIKSIYGTSNANW